MKKTICLLLALSMAAAVFTGCGSAADSFLPEGPHAPPDLALSDGEDSHEISPSGYSWSWSNSDGSRGSIIADAIHPLDNSILRFEPLSVPAGGAKYTLTFDQTPETLSFERFDIGDVGDTEAEPSEREDQIGKAVVLRGDSVYVFNASFEQGSARYYLITKQISTGDDALDYLMSEEYGNWWSSRQKAEEASRRYKDEMYAWYARALPALLPGGEDNAVCSPLNVYLALAMLAELSGGQTQAELLDALNAQDVEALRARYAALYAANENDTPTIKSLLANSVWLRDDYTYNVLYLDGLILSLNLLLSLNLHNQINFFLLILCMQILNRLFCFLLDDI